MWAGVDSVWEQEKPEARKMLENAGESHTSGARFVGRFFDNRLVVFIDDQRCDVARKALRDMQLHLESS